MSAADQPEPQTALDVAAIEARARTMLAERWHRTADDEVLRSYGDERIVGFVQPTDTADGRCILIELNRHVEGWEARRDFITDAPGEALALLAALSKAEATIGTERAAREREASADRIAWEIEARRQNDRADAAVARAEAAEARATEAEQRIAELTAWNNMARMERDGAVEGRWEQLRRADAAEDRERALLQRIAELTAPPVGLTDAEMFCAARPFDGFLSHPIRVAREGIVEAVKARDAEHAPHHAAAEATVEGLTKAVRDLLASAVPHPTEHPTMWAAWRKAEAALGKGTGDAH